MAKSTRHGGPSLTAEELADPTPPERKFKIVRPMLGEIDRPQGGASSAEDGLGFSPSFRSERTESGSKRPASRKPAPMTENHSEEQATETPSGAPTTDTDGQRKAVAPSNRKPSRGKPRARFQNTDGADALDEEFEDFD